MITREQLLFYDIECYKFDSLVVFKNYNGELVDKLWNDDTNRHEKISKLIDSRVLVGYNNHYYDDRMLFAMLKPGTSQDRLKTKNDRLISGEYDNKTESLSIVTLDVMQQIDVSKPSLKQIEGNMGISIEEAEIDFNIDRPLTAEERVLTEKYCEHDVDATIAIYKLRENSYFSTKEYIAGMLVESNPRMELKKVMKWNTTSIVGSLLNRNVKSWGKLGEDVEWWKNIWFNQELGIPQDVWNMWVEANKEKYPNVPVVQKQLLGCTIVFGFGGLHGVGTRKRYDKVKLLDVASMYPSILINMNALGEATDLYKTIKTDRIEAKHNGDKLRSDALKLILNSTYGLLKNKDSLIKNPRASSSICIYGQIAAFDLAKRLHEAGYELVNLNTDGVAFADNGTTDYERIWKEWEKDYNLTLECDDFDWWVQKDVNNYIACHDGKIKTKGGEVGKYQKENLFSNNSCRIVNIVLAQAIMNRSASVGQLLYERLSNQLDPKEWMYILKAGRTYDGVWDSKTDTRQQNVNRVFAVKEQYADIDLYKRRLDGGMVRFPDAPRNMKLWNRDCSEIDHERFAEQIDLDHYKAVITKKLEEWK